MTDDIIYKVTLKSGDVKIGTPQRLAGLKGHHRGRIAKVERVVVNNWTDVSGRHIEGYAYPHSSNPDTQIAWTLAYIKETYGPPEG